MQHKNKQKNMFFFVRLTEQQQQQYFTNLFEIKILP
jgi:hypothetical protein